MKPFIPVKRGGTSQRECLPVCDMTDCLLQAYDCVARCAYQKFVTRGGHPGGELGDWLDAERELLGNLSVSLKDGGEFLSALASLPGLSGKEVDVGIDPRWLVVLGRKLGTVEFQGQDAQSTDFDQVAAWVSTIHANVRSPRISCRTANTAVSSDRLDAPPRLPPHRSEKSDLAAVAVRAGIIDKRDSSKSLSIVKSDGEWESSASCASPDPCRNSNGTDHPDSGEGNAATRLFSILELPAEIDPSRCVAVLANGLLGIRMPKRRKPAH